MEGRLELHRLKTRGKPALAALAGILLGIAYGFRCQDTIRSHACPGLGVEVWSQPHSSGWRCIRGIRPSRTHEGGTTHGDSSSPCGWASQEASRGEAATRGPMAPIRKEDQGRLLGAKPQFSARPQEDCRRDRCSQPTGCGGLFRSQRAGCQRSSCQGTADGGVGRVGRPLGWWRQHRRARVLARCPCSCQFDEWNGPRSQSTGGKVPESSRCSQNLSGYYGDPPSGSGHEQSRPVGDPWHFQYAACPASSWVAPSSTARTCWCASNSIEQWTATWTHGGPHQGSPPSGTPGTCSTRCLHGSFTWDNENKAVPVSADISFALSSHYRGYSRVAGEEATYANTHLPARSGTAQSPNRTGPGVKDASKKPPNKGPPSSSDLDAKLQAKREKELATTSAALKPFGVGPTPAEAGVTANAGPPPGTSVREQAKSLQYDDEDSMNEDLPT